MSSVSFNPSSVQSATARGFGAQQQSLVRPQFGCGADTVRFSGSDDGDEKADKKGGVGSAMGKSVKYGCTTAALSVVAGLGLLAAAPFSMTLSIIPGIALLAGAPLLGFLGSAVGFIKGLKLG